MIDGLVAAAAVLMIIAALGWAADTFMGSR